MQLGIIFDMDGVIIDSNPYHKIAWSNFFEKKNIKINDEMFKNLIAGTTGDEAVIRLMDRELSKNELDSYNNEIDAEFRRIIGKSDDLNLVNGFLEFINSVSDANHKIALGTSAPPENVHLILNKFEIHSLFDLIVDKTQIVEGKPNPEIYLKTVHELGIPKERCIVFEDSIAGVTSASAAGLPVIGVLTSHSNKELQEVGAIAGIVDFTEITLEKVIEILRAQMI